MYIFYARNICFKPFFVLLQPKKQIFINYMKPLILISNDDGYQAKGINSLIDMLTGMGDIIVCAPDSARSGFSTAFTSVTPLRLKLQKKSDGLEIWSCNGTPVDCIKLAYDRLCTRRPDIVIGGINHGDNSSVNSHYSGTMGIVREGCMKHTPSVAFSLCDQREDADFSNMTAYVREITAKILSEGLPTGVCLNANFPLVDEYRGVKVCRMALGQWENEVVRGIHPSGYEYFWLAGNYSCDEPEAEDTDKWALKHGFVAVTPTRIDVTDYDSLGRMKNWF